jgi:hypothetical protein
MKPSEALDGRRAPCNVFRLGDQADMANVSKVVGSRLHGVQALCLREAQRDVAQTYR